MIVRSGCKSVSGLQRASFNKTLEKRFALACAPINEDGCIQWIGTKTAKGYGALRVSGGPKDSFKTTAHRISWVLARGDLEPGACVLHRCDNPSCVNPDHLFIGSPKENTEDMVSKGRHSWRVSTPWQKLGRSDAIRIREMRKAGCTQQQVADELGVSRPLVSMIENGKFLYSLPA